MMNAETYITNDNANIANTMAIALKSMSMISFIYVLFYSCIYCSYKNYTNENRQEDYYWDY